jgi:hypothetical protein
MPRILAGLFDNRGDAERTVEHLVQELHVDPAGIQVHGSAMHNDPAQRSNDTRQGVLRALASLFLPREDHVVFQEGVRRDGIVVVAQVKESIADRAMDVFEEYGAADLDARQADWRGSGWAPSQAGSTGHDEDIGFSTFGGDAVFGHIPRHHHDNSPAGLLGRMQMSAMRPEPARVRARVRSYVPVPVKK